MFRKLRRDSKQADSATSRTSSLQPVQDGDVAPPEGRLTWFDLPAELRNQIYELVIADATLSLPCSISLDQSSLSQKAKSALKKRKPPVPRSINGLLLASKKCRQEYLSVLLSTIDVRIQIVDFDFDGLMRVVSSLNAFEVQSLQSNRNLTLLLDTRNCTVKDMAALRRWLQYRVQDGKTLPWRYRFPIDARLPPSNMGKVRLVRELEYYADSIATIIVDLPSDQQDELGEIIRAFEDEAVILEEALGWRGQGSKANARNVRGLAGGGLL